MFYFNKALISSQCDNVLTQIEFLLKQIEDNVVRDYAYDIKNKIKTLEERLPVLSAAPHINGMMQAYGVLPTSPSLIVL